MRKGLRLEFPVETDPARPQEKCTEFAGKAAPSRLNRWVVTRFVLKPYPFLLLLAALVVLAPRAHATSTTDFVSLQVDPNHLLFQDHETVTGSDASDLRTEIDKDAGNGDGQVT